MPLQVIGQHIGTGIIKLFSLHSSSSNKEILLRGDAELPSQSLISILIPAYRRTNYLGRLLDSLELQNFRNFEVIVTDDTEGDEVKAFVAARTQQFLLTYVKNEQPKGTPLNWTAGLPYAKGDWIKIIHDDDWLSSENALQSFYDATHAKPDCIFSGYYAFYEADQSKQDKTITQTQFQRILRHPYLLFASNIIGPPSVLMFHRSMQELYDPSLKWLVDLEGYVRMMKRYQCVYISEPLIFMSYNATQVTNDCFRNPEVEIPEALVFYQKFGADAYRHVLTYDAWWRLLRNLSIRDHETLQRYAKGADVPEFLKKMLSFQQKIPASLLRIGIFSKCFMFICFLTRR